ncbi:MAG: methylenetetrahydrofolate reductase, partial [Hyphomicrobiaceae bacterium]
MASPAPTDVSAPRLADRFVAGQFVMTAEITPPVSADPARLLDKALPFRGLADAVNLTDSASARVHMCALAASSILAANGIDPIMQITCRDRNRIAIQADILGAAALGVGNFLIMTGDDPKVGDQPEAKGVFDLNSGQLIDMIRRMRDERELPTGRVIEGGLPGVMIGAADMPIDPPAGWEPKGLKAKANAGATFAQTQFCMDTDILRRYAGRLAEHGLGDRIKLIVGVVPLRSARSARWIRDNLYGSIIPDAMISRLEAVSEDQARAEGIRICVETIQEMRSIP